METNDSYVFRELLHLLVIGGVADNHSIPSSLNQCSRRKLQLHGTVDGDPGFPLDPFPQCEAFLPGFDRLAECTNLLVVLPFDLTENPGGPSDVAGEGKCGRKVCLVTTLVEGSEIRNNLWFR
ncbi:hypothetical protein KOR42_43680 [Thalassoglobus neptunius]|uniref:Uncharacterized protein n=1 Tax=Thalassoglobus neptunius TaxID=1938619 RepID=A0A5C5W8H3_9PLAN|nr:hypothetical protein KOR42_43680 [Thalassoglobus neptunius]